MDKFLDCTKNKPKNDEEAKGKVVGIATGLVAGTIVVGLLAKIFSTNTENSGNRNTGNTGTKK